MVGNVRLSRACRWLGGLVLVSLTAAVVHAGSIGQEVAIPRHLQDGEEFTISLSVLLEHGAKLFSAVWTDQEGGGRPLTKGTGAGLSNQSSPLTFPSQLQSRLSSGRQFLRRVPQPPRLGWRG